MNVDVQALAETVRAVVPNDHYGNCRLGQRGSKCDCGASERRAATAALDELVLEHTRQEEALRRIADPSGEYQTHKAAMKAGMGMRPLLPFEIAHAALSPPPVASGENAEEAQFTPEAWEKLTQQHQAFLARRSVASGTEGEE